MTASDSRNSSYSYTLRSIIVYSNKMYSHAYSQMLYLYFMGAYRFIMGLEDSLEVTVS